MLKTERNSAPKNPNRQMHIKGHWKPIEDAMLMALVDEYGTGNWPKISENIIGKSANSCRKRWCKQLDPRINRSPFTKEEDDLLLTAHQKHGNKWATIALLFKGRTDNHLKNRWYSLRRREMVKSRATKSRNLPPNTRDDPIIIEDDSEEESTEFYDFLQVNTNSGDIRSMERGKKQGVAGRETKFIDFMNVGSFSD